MKLDKLFKIQKHLDMEIIKEHGLKGKDLLDEKVLALKVELGELANETRCFKFWSYKQPSPREKILEEFVDCIHFLLSIAIEINFPIETYDFKPYVQDKDSTTTQFNACFYSISNAIDKDFDNESVEYMFENILGLGQILDFKEEDIIIAYLDKSIINFERLASGY